MGQILEIMIFNFGWNYQNNTGQIYNLISAKFINYFFNHIYNYLYSNHMLY